MTLRTIMQGTISIQGELKQHDNVFCSCSDGYIPIDRCDCDSGLANRATVVVNEKEYTGKLIPSVINQTPKFVMEVISENEDGSCDVTISMDEKSSDFFKKESEKVGMTIEDYIVKLLSDVAERKTRGD